MIVAQALTDSVVGDASTGIDLIETIASSARTVTADAAYDTLAFYETANTRRHDRRRAAGEDSQAVPTQPAVERSRWDDQKDQQDWAPSMEEGGRLSSTGPRRERVLPVQVDARRSTSQSDSRSASCRIGACVQRAQSNDRAWSTRVVRDRSVTNLRVGALGASFDLRNNAPVRAQVPARVRTPPRGCTQTDRPAGNCRAAVCSALLVTPSPATRCATKPFQ